MTILRLDDPLPTGVAAVPLGQLSGLLLLLTLLPASVRVIPDVAPGPVDPQVVTSSKCSGETGWTHVPREPIIAFGDSITWGYGATRNCLPLNNRAVVPLQAHHGSPHDTTYPAVLSRLLARPVLNYGQPGERTDQGEERLRLVLRNVHPSLVLLMEGVNDLLQGRGVSAAATNLRGMVRMALAAHSRVVLLTLTPITLARFRAREQAYQAQISSVGKALHVSVIDLHPFEQANHDDRLMIRPDGRDDYVHPNDAGYKLIAQLVANALVHPRRAYRRTVRASRMFRRTRVIAAVSHPSRVSTSSARERLRHTQASSTASAASVNEPSIAGIRGVG